MTKRQAIRIGTSGWNYPHWRGRFYPKGLPADRWFEHYAKSFDTVEINNTFYQLPEQSTFDHWRQQAPRGFLYAVKANRFITHMKKLKDPREPLENFLSRARRLGAHLGPILYQLPPHWKRNTERLEAFCRLLPRELCHVFEFRERDWLCDEVYDVLEANRCCLCVHDLLQRHPRRVTGPASYIRFHGAGEQYGGSYRRRRLRRWARWIGDVVGGGRTVYAYFNNDANAYAVHDARVLRELLDGASASPTHRRRNQR
ncbi:MAG: DUF72 domain-containing protein [Pirellulales bacterium]